MRGLPITFSEDIQEPALNCYKYFCNNVKKYGALNETTKALKLCQRYAERIVERGEIRASKEENMKRKSKFGKLDDFWKNLIREIIYSFCRKKSL